MSSHNEAIDIVPRLPVPVYQCDLRNARMRHVLAMQGQRILVCIGGNLSPFLVSRELLGWCSPILNEYIQQASSNSIMLPDVTEETFAAFVVWLNQYEHETLAENLDAQTVYELAIFAHQFKIYRLLNHATDFIHAFTAIPTTEQVKKIWDTNPVCGVLRELVVHMMVVNSENLRNGHLESRPEVRRSLEDKVRAVFQEFASIEAACFHRVFYGWPLVASACAFHDHSDISEPISPLDDDHQCPYTLHYPPLVGFEPIGLTYQTWQIYNEHERMQSRRPSFITCSGNCGNNDGAECCNGPCIEQSTRSATQEGASVINSNSISPGQVVPAEQPSIFGPPISSGQLSSFAQPIPSLQPSPFAQTGPVVQLQERFSSAQLAAHIPQINNDRHQLVQPVQRLPPFSEILPREQFQTPEPFDHEQLPDAPPDVFTQNQRSAASPTFVPNTPQAPRLVLPSGLAAAPADDNHDLYAERNQDTTGESEQLSTGPSSAASQVLTTHEGLPLNRGMEGLTVDSSAPTRRRRRVEEDQPVLEGPSGSGASNNNGDRAPKRRRRKNAKATDQKAPGP